MFENEEEVEVGGGGGSDIGGDWGKAFVCCCVSLSLPPFFSNWLPAVATISESIVPMRFFLPLFRLTQPLRTATTQEQWLNYRGQAGGKEKKKKEEEAAAL